MVFADLKNDFVFRRIFGTHPGILRGLLNDVLRRSGEGTIEEIEYLPSEQLPLVEGAKLSILDVRCKDRQGTTFVVEMQLIHHPGFINRVVYNACKAYVGQLKAGEWYTKLMDVFAISICDFELWPDANMIQEGAPRVPMLSQWNMVERESKHHDLLQVQYAFLELPKVPKERPRVPGADLWAWLFVYAPELSEVPADLSPGPYREALELANQAKFTKGELESYERVRDEIRQVLEISDAKLAQGKVIGRAEGKAEAILTILGARGILVGDAARARIARCADVGLLDRWLVLALTAVSTDQLV